MTKLSARSLFLLVAICFSLPLYAAPQNCSAPDRDDFRKTIKTSQRLVENYVRAQKIVGMTIAVSVCDTLIWSQGFGFADVENKVPVTPQTKFRIGSVSKTLTAAALAKLVEENSLDLDAVAQKYVPSFPKKKFPITPRQLAGHLAGIRHYKGDEFLISKYYPSVIEGLEVFQNDPLLHEPGTKYSYSSHGWNLLSAVIEGASGEKFLTYMQTQIFNPLGLKNTVADMNQNVIPYRTRFYQVAQDGTVSNTRYVDNSYKWASGGFLANAEDLNIFGNAMLFNKLVTKKTLQTFTTPQHTVDGVSTNYGMGWSSGLLARKIGDVETDFGPEVAGEVYRILKDQNLVGHSGGSVGGITLFWILPKSGISVAAMSNSNRAPTVAFNVAAEFVANSVPEPRGSGCSLVSGRARRITNLGWLVFAFGLLCVCRQLLSRVQTQT